MFLNYFNILILKKIKKLKNIINIYFNTKIYLKHNYNYNIKRALTRLIRPWLDLNHHQTGLAISTQP